jgi:hypothetical protein
MAAPSSIRRVITVQFEHERAPKTTLTISARLRPELILQPAELSIPTKGDPQPVRLTVSRGALTPKEFGEVALIADAAYYTIKDIEKTADRITYEVAMSPDRAPAVLDSLAVRYANAFGPQSLRVPVKYRQQDGSATIFPNSYFFVVDRAVMDDLQQASSRSFRVVDPEFQSLIVTGLLVKGVSDEQDFLAWELGSDFGEPDAIKLWIEHVPARAALSTVAFISYRNADNSIQRQAAIDVNVVALGGDERSAD